MKQKFNGLEYLERTGMYDLIYKETKMMELGREEANLPGR